MSDLPADLDPAFYGRPPVPDVPGGIALSTALLEVLDPTMPAAVQQAAEQIQTTVLVLQRRVSDQRNAESGSEIDAQSADLRLDRAWVAVARRLEVLVDLPPSLPQVEQAAHLMRRLFPDGLSFLNLPFRRQWAQSEKRLRIVEDEDLGPLIGPLVGGFVLDELWAAHEEYGRVLGIDDPKAALGAPARVAEALRELRDAIAAYGLQLVALAQSNPDLLDSIRASLHPLTRLRRPPPVERAEAPDEPQTADEGEST